MEKKASKPETKAPGRKKGRKRRGPLRKFLRSAREMMYLLRKERFPQLVGLIIFVAVAISTIFGIIEGGKGEMLDGDANVFQKICTALYYSFVTITTVGYGDYSPKTPVGRIIAVMLMLFGAASVSMVTATIASIFVERKIREGRGLIRLINTKDHIILCGWKKQMAKLLTDILAINDVLKPKDLVVVANVDPDTIEVFRQQNPGLREVNILRGEHFNENILKLAQVREAKSVYLLSDESDPNASPSEIDSKTVMAAMAIRNMSKNVHLCAELLDAKFRSYLENVHVSEMIFSTEYSRSLIANSTISTGLAKVINDLLDATSGNWLFTREIPDEFVGKEYSDLKKHFSDSKNLLLVGVVENIGSYFEMKTDALRQAQKTADISQLVKNLNDVKKMKSNNPVINPPDTYKIRPRSLTILIKSEHEEN